MFSVDALQYAITNLYQGGVDGDFGYEADDVEAMLNTISFPALLQAVRHKMQTVYAYVTQGKRPKSFNYRGPELFGQEAVCLYVDFDQTRTEIATVSRSLELWLLADMTIVPVACISLYLGDNEYVTEYRAVLEDDPWNSGMDLDLNELTDVLIEMCVPCFKNEQPVYEL